MVAFGQTAIAQMIQYVGPASGLMEIHDDFYNYAGGIYETTIPGEFNGYHAVRIIGWGYEPLVDVYYWICSNSWHMEWGENGFFRIEMG